MLPHLKTNKIEINLKTDYLYDTNLPHIVTIQFVIKLEICLPEPYFRVVKIQYRLI